MAGHHGGVECISLGSSLVKKVTITVFRTAALQSALYILSNREPRFAEKMGWGYPFPDIEVVGKDGFVSAFWTGCTSTG